VLVSEVFVEKLEALFGVEEFFDAPNADHRGGGVILNFLFELL
jgi:hypothetical protein